MDLFQLRRQRSGSGVQRWNWGVESGEWRVASGEWEVASGKWRVGSGGGVIVSGSDAIQLMVQEETGLPRRFAPRNDGAGLGEKCRALARLRTR